MVSIPRQSDACADANRVHLEAVPRLPHANDLAVLRVPGRLWFGKDGSNLAWLALAGILKSFVSGQSLSLYSNTPFGKERNDCMILCVRASQSVVESTWRGPGAIKIIRGCDAP